MNTGGYYKVQVGAFSKKANAEAMAQDIGKALQELSKAIENNEAVESVVIKITLKKQKSGKASNPKESK